MVELEPKNATIRSQLEATKKLLRKIEFEKAIATTEGPQAWETVATHLLEGTGGTTLDSKYTGPRLAEGEEDAEATKDPLRRGKHLGRITEGFINEMIQWFRDGNRLPLRYCWQIILGARRQFEKEPTMVEYQVKQGTTATVYGDIHGQLFDFLHAFDLSGRPSEKNMILFNGVRISCTSKDLTIDESLSLPGFCGQRQLGMRMSPHPPSLQVASAP